MTQAITSNIKTKFSRLVGGVGSKTIPASMLYTSAILMLVEIAKAQDEMLKRSEKAKLAKRVEALGFTRAYNVAEQEKINKRIEHLQFMIEMWRDLGPNTMLVGYDHFREILHRHDLMCVTFDLYQGDIPKQNIVDIERVINQGLDYKYARILSWRSLLVQTRSQLLDAIRFPFYFEGNDYFDLKMGRTVAHFTYGQSLRGEQFFIAAPKWSIRKPQLQIYESQPLRLIESRNERTVEEIRFANLLLDKVTDYVNVVHAQEPSPLSSKDDPFVCSLCDYGVIIHSKWGVEAENRIIKRYEELRETIIKRGGKS